eukprot:2051895-Pyramimonas_sp.AAC.1
MITSVLAFGLPLKKRAGASAICEGVDRIKITDDMMLRLLSKVGAAKILQQDSPDTPPTSSRGRGESGGRGRARGRSSRGRGRSASISAGISAVQQQQAVPDMGAPSFQFDADEADCDALDHWKHTVDRLVSIDSRQEDGIRSMMSIGLYMIMANTTSVELLVDGKVKKVKGWTELVRLAKLHVYKMAKLAPRVSDPDLVDGGDA